MALRVLDASVFATLSPPRLAGSRCGPCGTSAFPRQRSCPRCGEASEQVALPRSGTVWTWTVQHVAPKEPYQPPAEGFVPFAVGYVDLGDLLVESRLAVTDLQALRIGLPVRLALLPLWRDPDGLQVATYAFALDEDDDTNA